MIGMRENEKKQFNKNHDTNPISPNNPAHFHVEIRSQSIRLMLAHPPASEIESLCRVLLSLIAENHVFHRSTSLHAPEEVPYQKMLVKKGLGQAHPCHV